MFLLFWETFGEILGNICYEIPHLFSNIFQVPLRLIKVSFHLTEVSLRHTSLFVNMIAVQNQLCCLTVLATPHHMEFSIVHPAELMGFCVVQMVHVKFYSIMVQYLYVSWIAYS